MRRTLWGLVNLRLEEGLNMKTVIWDNGCEYSSHTVHFLEVEDGQVDDLVAALKLKNDDEGGFVVGVGGVDWREGGSGDLSDIFGVHDDLPDWMAVRVCREKIRYQEERIVRYETSGLSYAKGGIANAKGIIEECKALIADRQEQP
jgi:hypothetical protein